MEETVGLSPEVAAVLDEPDPPFKEVTFTDLTAGRPRGTRGSGSPDEFVEVVGRGAKPKPIGYLRYAYEPGERGKAAKRAEKAGEWQGPRLSFDRYLGESAIWRGPEWLGAKPCPFCRGRRLGGHEYCLGCNRSGKDGLIPHPTEAELRMLRRAERDGLAGGRGSKAARKRRRKAAAAG
jgi:hypothetical protein